MLHALIPVILSVSTVTVSQSDFNSKIEFIRESNLLYNEEAVLALVAVAKGTNVDPLILVSILERESGGGDPLCTNFCVEWGKYKKWVKKKGKRVWVWRWKCKTQYSCQNCWGKGAKIKRKRYSAADIRRMGTDLGRWQLRRAPLKLGGSSWIRYFNKVTGRKEGADCAYDFNCSNAAMVEAVKYMMEHPRFKCRSPYIPEMQWVGSWNGCKSYRRHIKRFGELTEQYKKWVAERPEKSNSESEVVEMGIYENVVVVCVQRKLGPLDGATLTPEGVQKDTKLEPFFTRPDASVVDGAVYRTCRDNPPPTEGVWAARIEVEKRDSGIDQVGTVHWIRVQDLVDACIDKTLPEEPPPVELKKDTVE